MIGDPTKLVIRTRFPRLSAAELAPFQGRSTSFVVDAMNGRRALHHAIKPLDPRSRLVGSALTARAGARDNMARIAQTRGGVGVVTDGMARDAAEIVALGLPVFCRGVTPNSAFPSGPGEVGLPLAMGEVTIESGDLIIGDRDGVVAVPRAQVAAVTARLELVAAQEAERHATVTAGEIRSLLDRYPELGDQITYVD